MIFRHKRSWHPVVMSVDKVNILGRPPLHAPMYWLLESAEGSTAHEIVPGTEEELRWMQELLDGTHMKVATRDRRGKRLADRFVAVSCVRSEHPALWDKYAQRRLEVFERCQRRDGSTSKDSVVPKTTKASPGLAERCKHVSMASVGQCYLLHGTNPTSAMAILGTSFKVDLAGTNAGSMFGKGIYLAESSTKADEYAYDDCGGAYNNLYAILVCRAVIGRPWVVQERYDYSQCGAIREMQYDCVIGDRERAVGTFREFVFFNEASIYPEYVCFYRREFQLAPASSPRSSAPLASASPVVTPRPPVSPPVTPKGASAATVATPPTPKPPPLPASVVAPALGSSP